MSLGEKLKNIRTSRSLSLEDLAKKTNLTRSFLSQVEKNKTSPSVSSLIKIATALGIRVGDLFVDADNVENFIVPEGERKFYVVEKDKLKVELLAPRKTNLKFEPMLIRFGSGGTTGEVTGISGAAFFCLVLKGKLELAIRDKVHILKKGDSVYIDTPVEHTWKNVGKTEVVAFGVAATPIIM